MAIDHSGWQRDWAVTPGEILQEALEERDMSQSELARRMGRPIKTINEIVRGKAAITPDTAIQLERALGVSATLWNNLETAYREHLARLRAQEDLEARASWVDSFPIRDLVAHEVIDRGPSKADTLGSLLRFFGVSSPSAWEAHWLAPAASYRASPTFESSPHAVAAWLRWGERAAFEIKTEAFDSEKLRIALDEIRGWTRREPMAQTVVDVQNRLAETGVALVITPEIGKTHLSGAARWLSAEKAIIQLSLRHKSDDHFWFTLFHEAGHLLAGQRRDFLDAEIDGDQQDEAEEIADQFSRDALIPPEAYEQLRSAGSFTERSVRDFAREIGIAPGVVVGRLQRDGYLPMSHLNGLKRSLQPSRRRRA